MIIIKPSSSILNASPDLEKIIELSGRVCYKSEDRITDGSADAFIGRLFESKHESVLEHGAITVHIVCDRGVSHEIVRHRLCSFSQESTRYCNYSKGKFRNQITVIEPCVFPLDSVLYEIWHRGCEDAENCYFALLSSGATPQEARSVLPNSLKTEIVVTANPREWKWIFEKRCHPTAHPQMREIMIPLQEKFRDRWPSLFNARGSDDHAA